MSHPARESRTRALGGPTVAGVRLADASAAVGAVVWVAALSTGELGPIDRALALAPLVLVPLGLTVARTAAFEGTPGRLAAAATLAQFPAAALLTASLLVPGGIVAGALALPWLLVAAALALAGALRLRERVRSTGPVAGGALAETTVDAGLIYLPAAAVALVGSHLGITLWFEPVIVRLTAVHFHYAGFVLPVVAGVAARSLPDPGRAFRAVVGVVAVGPALIAVGIAFSPLVEVASVAAFTVAVAGFGGLVVRRVAPTRPRGQAALLAVSALALPVSMLLALGFGVGEFVGWAPPGLDLGTMVLVHGSLNAFGFALAGLVGWRLTVPPGPARSD